MRPFLSLLLLFCLAAPARAAEAPPAPPAGLILPASGQPADIAAAFLNIPYREDGALDENNRWTLFSNPTVSYAAPGLNCSGFALALSRYLLRRTITLEKAKHDRAGDSGPGAALGQDWDFGLDLIRNIADGSPRELLLPGGATGDPDRYDGRFRGFDLNAADTWKELLPRFKPGRLYLLSFSKETRRAGYVLMHYHVGVILKGAKGETFLFQTTSDGGKVNRRDLSTSAGLASLHRDFADNPGSRKMIAVLEVLLPETR